MTSELKNYKYFLKLGLDPFEKKLNKDYLFSKFKNSKSSIKQLLLNQKIVTGIGNIYACEILYDAKISPFMPGNQLSLLMIERLIKSMKKILKKAILYGGTTLRDYIATDGTLGNFQTKFKVYNKEDKKILNFKIRRIKQSGRSTFFCPDLQKSKYNPIFD
jgi:formamidopyrimidine-DNA glycosylase